LRRIDALEEPMPVSPPRGMVYSTQPKRVLGTDGVLYYLKGPQQEVVFPEAVCYEFANELDLKVPDCALCRVVTTNTTYFASRGIKTRSALETLISQGRITNPQLLPDMIAFDVWVANIDRNIGNIVGEPAHNGQSGSVTLHAIDFEKAQTLCGTDRFTVGAIEPERLWPKDALGTLCETAPFPRDLCTRIAALGGEHIVATLERIVWDLGMPTISYLTTSKDMLTQRAAGIERLVREVWNV